MRLIGKSPSYKAAAPSSILHCPFTELLKHRKKERKHRKITHQEGSYTLLDFLTTDAGWRPLNFKLGLSYTFQKEPSSLQSLWLSYLEEAVAANSHRDCDPFKHQIPTCYFMLKEQSNFNTGILHEIVQKYAVAHSQVQGEGGRGRNIASDSILFFSWVLWETQGGHVTFLCLGS